LIFEGKLAEGYDHASALNVVVFVLTGTTRVEWRRGGRFTRFVSQPGSLMIIPAGGDHHFHTDRQARVLAWMIGTERLQSIADQEGMSRGARVEIREAINHRDEEFWSIGQRLSRQLLAPIPGSRLYAEALNTKIALQLLWGFSSLSGPRDARTERLTHTRLKRVIDYIHSSLGNEITLDELADLAELSPNYFLSSFRRATGKTPHRYLTEQRIAKACELLHNPHRSIVDVSLAVGFSSQSHLTDVFHRLMNTTPAAYRRQILGMDPRRNGKGS
jgi:AraC family transcriptional regulator